MQLTITPEVEALLQQELQSGRFHEPNDVLATALLVLRDSTPRNLAGLDTAIQEGLDAADTGDLHTEEQARAHLASLRARL